MYDSSLILVNEVSRYLHGTTGIESSKTPAWKHSKSAFFALENGYIGSVLGSNNEEEWCLISTSNKAPIVSREEWTLTKREDLSQTTSYYFFKNPSFRVKLAYKGVDWIGKHWVISHNGKSRLYTNCLMLDPEVQKYRNDLIMRYENSCEGTDHVTHGASFPTGSDSLVLVIKDYREKTALSHILATARLDSSKFLLEGPIV